MPNLVQHLLVLGAFQGLLLFGLLTLDSRASTANRILAILCLLLALFFLSPFITLSGELNSFSFLIGWFFFLPASYGALNYLYYRHAVTGSSLAWKDLWHITPLLLCYLLNLDWLVTSPEARLQLINSTGGPFSSHIGFKISLYIFYIQAFAYNIASARLIYRYQTRAQNTLANFNPDIFRWLWTFLILTFLIWSLKAIADITSNRSYSTLADVLIVIFIYSVSIAQWRSPKLFRVEKLQTDSNNSITDNGPDAINNTETPSGVLDESTRKNLLVTTKKHMQQHKPYLDNQLTLNNLAETIGLSSHHLSEVLNQQEGKNFYQFVNQYRINHILAQLNQDQSSKILDLAMSAGFSSKSTFNAVFKQFTGQTPSQYRKAFAASK